MAPVSEVSPIWQWLAENAPVLALVLGAICVVLLCVLGILAWSVAGERGRNRRLIVRQRQALRVASSSNLAREQAEVALARAVDWQASVATGLSALGERARATGDAATAMAAAVALGDLARAQTELERGRVGAVVVPSQLDELVRSASALGLRIVKTEIGERRPMRPGMESAFAAVVREALQTIAQEATRASMTVIRVVWDDLDVVLELEHHREVEAVVAGRHARPSGWISEPLGELRTLRDATTWEVMAMRDHVERHGGIFVAAELPGGEGFVVRAVFPGVIGAVAPALSSTSPRAIESLRTAGAEAVA